MKKNSLIVMFLFVCYLFSTPSFADTGSKEMKQSLCLVDAGKNSDHPQQILENWTSINRRQNQGDYEQQISQLEASRGVFDYAIVSELIGLGFLFQEQLSHAQAADAFQRALHIIRINDGLYSTKQLPVIDFLIESNTSQQEWKRVADSYDLMYWLYRRNYADNDPRQLHTIKRLRRWYIESYNKDTGRSLEQLFTSAESLYKQGLKIMHECTGNKRQALCFWHKSCCAGADKSRAACPVELG